MYNEDIKWLGGNLYFQQDGAPCHTSKDAMDYIDSNFQKKLEFWPPNSLDLSPIEELRAILEEKLNKYQLRTLPELCDKLIHLWNKIPATLCKNLVKAFDEKINKVKNDGERANKRVKTTKTFSGEWKNKWNKEDYVERIVYNQEAIERIKNKKIKKGIKGNYKH